MGAITRESFKPRVRRAGAGVILLITLAFLVGAFIDDCGFFPGRGASGGNPLDQTDDQPPKPPEDTAGDDGGSGSQVAAGSGSPAAGSGSGSTGRDEEGVVVELRDDRLHYRGKRIGWDELETIAKRLAAEDPPRSLTLTIDSGSVTFGFVEKARERLEASGVRVVEDTR